MLIQFSVENYRSFREKATLSLEAAHGKENIWNVFECNGERFLRSLAIYGANASGKTNLILAISAAVKILRSSDSRQINMKIPVYPFSFTEEEGKPTSFEFTFITEGVKYVYGYSCTADDILEEHLIAYRTAKPSLIFSREMDTYRFPDPKVRKELEAITGRNTHNKLFLSTATSWNAESTKAPFLWLTESIHGSFSGKLDKESLEPFINDTDDSLKSFTLHLLRNADPGINDYTVEKETDSAALLMLPESELYRIRTQHLVSDGNSKKHPYTLQMKDESRGTENIFYMSPRIKEALDTGGTYCVDEIDASLHPNLLQYIIELFSYPETNPRNAQLIATLHESNLLKIMILRRDQIYFIEKDNDTGMSGLYPLTCFSPTTRDDIRRSYLAGRFGAVPSIM